MSFADELRKAEKRMRAQLEQEAQKKSRKRATPKGSSTRTSMKSSSGSQGLWSIEDDIIALYLQLTEASKFFKENYSKKRKVSVRAMESKMTEFDNLMKNKKSDAITMQMREVHQKFGKYDHKELQQVVIAILRNEYSATGTPSTPKPMTQTDPNDKPMVKRRN